MPHKINDTAWRQGFGFAICLIAILALAGVPISVTIKAVAVIATQIVSGAYIYSCIPRSKSPTMPEYLGMGFAIGSALSTLCDIIMKSTVTGSVGWLVPTFVIFLIKVGKISKKDRDVVTNTKETKFEWNDLFAILVISFLYLAHEFHWYISLFVSGLSISVAANLKNRCKTRGIYLRSVTGLTAVATVSLLTGIRLRSSSWWISSDDYQLFESLQISLARYGPQDHLGASGTSITNYHFLSYAWTGLVDRVSDAPTWLILNRITPVVVSVIVSALVWSFLSREGIQRPKLRFLLACLYPALFVFSFKSPSSAIGIIFLLAAIFYWTDRGSTLNHWHRIPLGILFTIFVIGTKTSNVPAIIVGLGGLSLISAATNQSWKWVSLVDLLTALATGALYYSLLLRVTTGESLILVTPFGFAKERFGDLKQLSGPWLIIIGGIVSSAYLIMPLLGLIISMSFRKSRMYMLGLFTLPLFPLLVFYVLFINGNTSRYFVNSILSIMLLIALLAVSRSFSTGNLSNREIFQLAIFVAAGITLGVAEKYLVDNLRSGGRIAMFERAVATAHWIPLVVIGVLFFVYHTLRKSKPQQKMAILGFILVGEICANTTVAALNLYEATMEPPFSVSFSEQIIGTPDEIAVGNEIKSQVPPNSIIASNHFCGREKCFGADWFKKPWLDSYDGTLFGGSNLVLPAYSERRFLIQGPRFLWGLNDPPTWATDRMNATLAFANSPDRQTLQGLRNFDVEYFVVDLESTTQRNWSPFGEVLYQNHSFAFLQLRSD